MLVGWHPRTRRRSHVRDRPIPADHQPGDDVTAQDGPREDAADQRDRDLHEQEASAESTPLAQAPTDRAEQRRLGVIERGHALLAANGARIERSEAWIRRVRARTDRQLGEEARRVADSERALTQQPLGAAQPSHSDSSTQRVIRLQLVEAALRMAEIEDKIADDHENLASKRPDRAAELQRTAEDAREGARRAREIARQFRD